MMMKYLVSTTTHDAETHEQIDAWGGDYTEGNSAEEVKREWTAWEAQEAKDCDMVDVYVVEEAGVVYYTDDEGDRVYVRVHVDEVDDESYDVCKMEVNDMASTLNEMEQTLVDLYEENTDVTVEYTDGMWHIHDWSDNTEFHTKGEMMEDIMYSMGEIANAYERDNESPDVVKEIRDAIKALEEVKSWFTA